MIWSNVAFYTLILIIVPTAQFFNLDTGTWRREYDIGDEGAMFGYSITLVNNQVYPLLVGAPEFNDIGAIFKCGVNGGRCDEVLFKDNNGARSDARTNQTGGQKFGFTLSRIGERVMACAPRFKEMSGGVLTPPVGRCTVLDQDLKFLFSKAPCKSMVHHNVLLGFGYCVAGTSATGMFGKGSQDDPVYFVGTPGARHLMGLVLSFDAQEVGKARERFGDFDRNDYVGYSVSSGKVIDGRMLGDVMTGAPRGNKLNGHAILYNYKNNHEFSWKTVLFNPHEQLGSYYGGSVCVVDMNGDRKDDVLIGAPYYSKVSDEGRVYIYENIGDTTYDVSDGNGYKYKGLERSGFLDGDNKVGSRFGTSIVNIGDLNKDGYSDVAVGAPGGDVGAVYIYNGAEDGLKNEYTQVIYASSIPGTPKGFGISIASGVDIDGNTYNDLAIGAYLSGKAYVFKSRPIINIHASQTTNKNIIKPEERFANCNWKGLSYHCITLDLSVRYTGAGTQDRLDLTIEFSLDHEAIRKRALMKDEAKNDLVSRAQRAVNLQKDTESNLQIQLYIKGITLGVEIDMLQPIILLSSFTAQYDQSNCGSKPCGVLDSTKNKGITSEVLYEHKCGNDVICEPDISVESSILFPNNPGLEELKFGVVYDFVVKTLAVNLGEPGYQAKLMIAFSKDFNVDRVEIDGRAYPVWDVETREHDKQLKFVFANPIKGEHKFEIAAKFSVAFLKPANSTYRFYVEATSLGNELNPADNKEVLEVVAKVDACLSVDADVSPSYVLVRTENKGIKVNGSINEIGTEIEHTFIVKNEAEVPVESLVAQISFVAVKDDIRLMCVSEVSVDGHPCNPIPETLSCQSIVEDPTIIIGNFSLKGRVEESLSCSNADCMSVSCNIKEIHQRKGARITVKSRLIDRNFVNVRQTMIESSALIKFEGDRADLFVLRTDCSMSGATSLTVHVPVNQREAEQIPFWIIIAAAVGALLLLAIIIVVLCMKGFFTRKRPNVEDEDEDDEDDEEA